VKGFSLTLALKGAKYVTQTDRNNKINTEEQ
jgi:hypothetical protein